MGQALTKSSGVRDLTTGSIPRHLVTFAVPMLIGNMLQALYNTVDAIWVGRFLGPQALAAVSVSFPIIFVLITLLMGVTMATTVMVAQYAGAKQTEMVKRTVNNSMLLLLGGGVIASVLGILLRKPLLRLIHTPPEILDDAAAYMMVFMGGLVFMFGSHVFGAILRGLGDSRTPLVFLTYATITNIILDPILIFGLGPIPSMGIQGAALATVLAQALATGIAIRHLNRRNQLVIFDPRQLRFDVELTKSVIRIGLPAGIQQVAVSMGSLVLISIVNRFGHVMTAAYGAGIRLDGFALMPLMSLGMAVSAMVGQNLGAGYHHRVKEIVRWGVIMSSSLAVFFTVLMVAFPGVFMSIFTADAKVLAAGVEFLRIVSLSFLGIAVLFTFGGALRGAGDTVPTMLISTAALWLLRIPLAAYLSSTALGARGIWLAMFISPFFGGGLSVAYYLTGRWRQKVVVKGSDPTTNPKPQGDNERAETPLVEGHASASGPSDTPS